LRGKHERDCRPWLALGVVSLAAFIMTVDGTVLNVAAPVILSDFGTNLPTQ